MISGRLALLQHVERPRHRLGRRQLPRRRVDDLDQRPLARLGVDRLPEKLGRQVEIDAAGAPRHRRANGARHGDADVLGVQHAEGGLAQRLGDRQLVHLLVVALLQVDDLALRRAGDQDHRKAVRRGVGERGQPVQEARRRDREADPRLPGQKAGDRGGVAGVLLVAERDHPHALGLRQTTEIGDRNPGDPVDRVDPVQLQGVDHEVEAVGQRLRRPDFRLFYAQLLGSAG